MYVQYWLVGGGKVGRGEEKKGENKRGREKRFSPLNNEEEETKKWIQQGVRQFLYICSQFIFVC